MRIGVFVEKLPYYGTVSKYRCGGGEIVAHNLAIEMEKKGHSVFVFTTSANFKSQIEGKGNLIINRYSSLIRIYDRNVSLSSILKPLKYDVDVVHLHLTISPISTIAAMLYSLIKNKPLVATYHGDLIFQYKNLIDRMLTHYVLFLMKFSLNHAKVIISPSKYFINESRILQQYKNKIVVVTNGIHLENFPPYSKQECRQKLGLPINKNIILFLSFLYSKKGPDVLINAMPKILHELHDTELIIVGEGPLLGDLEELVKKLNIAHSVKFTGFIEEKLKPFYYNASDVFVLPSTATSESFGIVNLEAMACGVPVVASRIGGIPDVIQDGQVGILFPPGDSNALADAIIYLLQNERVREKMGNNAKERTKYYNWDNIAYELEQIYKQIMCSKGR